MWTLKVFLFNSHHITPVMTFFKGGGSPKPPKQQKVEMPKPPKPLPPPAPATEFRPDVSQVAADVRTREAKKKGIGATLLAGETGSSGKRTLLG